MTSSFFVTGGAGFIGRALIARLASAGERVAAMDLAPRPPEFSTISWTAADILDDSAYADRLAGIETVVHLAAKVHAVPRSPGEAKLSWRINLEGTTKVIRTAVRMGVRRFVFVSTVAVFSSDRGTLSDSYAQSKRAAEQAVLEFKDRISVVIVRPATVYGPNDRGNVYNLIRWICRGLPPILGRANNKKSMVFVHTLADAIVFIADRGENGGAYVVTDCKDYTMEEIVATIFRALGKRNRWPAIPLPMASAFARMNGWLSDKIGLPRIIEKETIEKMVEETIFDSGPLKELGFSPPDRFEEGIAEEVRWYLRSGR